MLCSCHSDLRGLVINMEMKVTGHLRDPNVQPCPGQNDLSMFKDDQCRPVKCTRQPDMTGLDCCQYWKNAPNVWASDAVRVDQVNPERFQYDQYRYQMFSKPSNLTPDHYSAEHSVPDKYYTAPDTDIRALRQTMYIPVVPTKPGGVTDFTFPMTPQTMNDPDVTTACCVPVIPCNPGFQNLTPSVRDDPNYMCQTYSSRSNQHMQMGHHGAGGYSNMHHPSHMSMSGPAPEYMVPPSNQPGSACLGFQNTFPDPHQLYATPFPAQLHAPHFNAGMGEDCSTQGNYDLGMDDGMSMLDGTGAIFTSAGSIRYKDRVARAIIANAETPEHRAFRLKSMFGSFGSHLVSNPACRRQLKGTSDNIIEQGNGFHWSYPKHENRLCYIIKRNPRC